MITKTVKKLERYKLQTCTKRGVFISIIMILLFSNVFSQSSLYKEWYSGSNYLKITHRKSTVNSYDFEKVIIKKQNNSTLLTFIDYYWKAGSLKRFKREYQFEIIKMNDDTLILSALNEESKICLHNQSPVLFVPHIWLGNADANFHFQNLTFKYNRSLSFTKEAYEIDSVGNIKYSIENFLDNKQSYSGILNSKEINKLVDLLSRYDISRYDNGVTTIDGHYFFIEIKHNNTISKMETMCYFPKSDEINILIDFILNFSKKFTEKTK